MRNSALSVLLCLLSVWSPVGRAEDQPTHPGLEGWLAQDGATGTWGGARPALADVGIDFFGGYAAEVWGNTTGGVKTGTVYTGLLDFGVEVDLEKLVGWPGAKVGNSWLWLSGQDASEQLAGNFLTISNLAGFNTLRMEQLWFEQKLFHDTVAVKFGQLSADAEFVISDHAALFLNGTFGWPAFLYLNLPAGGPGYPMGTLGARVAWHPVDGVTLQSAVFQGNVYDQNVNRHGFRWRLDGENGFLFLNEAQVRWTPGSGQTGQAKAGFWAQTGQLADTLAASTQSGNFGWYFIVDQTVFREPAPERPVIADKADGKTVKSFQAPTEESDQGLAWFGRLAFQKGDRNFLNFYFDTGLTYKGLVPTRDEDTLGVAFAYAQIGGTAGAQLLDDGLTGVGAEMVLEATYQIQVTPWFAVQPDLQFIINPGGSNNLRNALVIGSRFSVTF